MSQHHIGAQHSFFLYPYTFNYNSAATDKTTIFNNDRASEPGKRLSWQYHERRAEIWKVLNGRVEIMISDSDSEPESKIYQSGDIIQLGKGQRHRLKGLTEWGIVAEIWQHTDNNHPSDEEDIVRVKDDFGRE